jgi:nucleoside-diphosphate-sugar epimerase
MQAEKILVVGCTSQVAQPVAKALAADNEVTGIARFSSRRARKSLEESGVSCQSVDLAAPDLSALAQDFTYVLNFSVARTGNWEFELDVNAGSIGLIMEHCRSARAFFHCSTAGVYQPQPDHVFTEDDPLGDNHRAWESTLPFLSTYSISKIASEAAVRYGSRRWELPAVIARLSVPYGDNGGWPAFHLEMMASGHPIEIHRARPVRCNPIHEDDIIATILKLLKSAASVPPTVVNWGGTESSVDQWCTELGALTGLEPRFTETPDTIASLPVDTSRLTSLIGPVDSVSLNVGLERMVRARRPGLLTP